MLSAHTYYWFSKPEWYDDLTANFIVINKNNKKVNG